MDFRRPFWTDFVLDGEPDTLCLANFRLSRWDERRRQNHFAMDDWGNWRLNSPSKIKLTMIDKCLCQKCGQSIEFDVEQNLAFVDCPNCGKQTVLNTPSVQSPKFFVWQNEQQQGPFDANQIRQMILERKITGETLVCPEDGGLDWTPAKKLFFPGSSSGGSWEHWEQQATAPATPPTPPIPPTPKPSAPSSPPPNQQDAKKPKSELPEEIGFFGVLFCFITGAILLFRGADEIDSPEHDSVFPQIYGIIELVGGFLMIGIGLLIQCLGKIHRKL